MNKIYVLTLFSMFLSGCATNSVTRKIATTTNDQKDYICHDKDLGFSKGCVRYVSMDSNCSSGYAFYKECRSDLAQMIPVEMLGKIEFDIETNFGEDNIYKSLPELPDQVINQYSSKEIALSLVQRKFLLDEVKNINNDDFNSPRINLFENLQIIMEIPSKYLSAIKKNGFKNLHQTGNSSAFKDTEMRIKRESLFFKVKFSDKKHKDKIQEILPKYAYAIPFKDDNDLGPSYMAGYSDLVVVFKNKVKLFSTLTNDDSLFGSGGLGLLDVKGKGGFLPPLTFTALNTDCRAFRNQCLENTSNDKGYLEAQIWGPLTWKDVDFIVTGCYPSVISEKKILDIVSNTVPVYRCNPILKSGKIIRVEKGDLISN